MFSFDTKREPEKCMLRRESYCLAQASKDAPLGQEDAAEGCSLLVAKENQKTTSDFDALEPRKRGYSPLLTPKRRATPEKTEDSRLFGVKIF